MTKLSAPSTLVAYLLLLAPSHPYSPIPILYDSSNHLHRNIQYHPEQPARIDACTDALAPLDFVQLHDVSVGSPSSFSPEELMHARAMLIEAHSEEFVSNLEQRCRGSRQRRIDEGKPPLGFVGYIDDDTYVTTETFDVCLRAAAAWIRAVDMAMCNVENNNNGQRPRVPAMALTRPPGHHATKLLANGFCVFNFAAAAVLHALGKYPDIKVSILDWDVHYGQGVADIVQRYYRARYVSIHQLHAFPYMGETCAVVGEHANIMTIPIPAETTWSCGYEQALTEKAFPFLRTEGEWDPDLVLVCAGYDALDSDELASVSLQAVDYGRMARQLRDYISPTAGLMLGMEGGYQLGQYAGGGNLADAVVETVKALVE
jgi:acetoin utilization deacetylase AcuC-like enzyme